MSSRRARGRFDLALLNLGEGTVSQLLTRVTSISCCCFFNYASPHSASARTCCPSSDAYQST